MFCAVLYGEIRTLALCLPSIKRLFCDTLNVEFYVVINKSKNKTHDYEYYENLINTNLNVKSYDLCDINQNDLCLLQQKKEIYKNLKIKTNLISFEDYSKLQFNKKLYTNEELNGFSDKIESELNKEICAYPYNQYIEDYLINIAMKNIPEDKYSHVFRLRTDIAWFEDSNIKQKYAFDNGTNNTYLIEEYNNNISSYNFHNFKKLITTNLDEKEIIISSLNLIYNSVLVPCAHAQLMPFLIFKKYVEFFNDDNIDKILGQIQKYPVLYYHWGGELQQKKVFQDLNITINENFYLCAYHCIIRE